jgi:hypothetical protein
MTLFRLCQTGTTNYNLASVILTLQSFKLVMMHIDKRPELYYDTQHINNNYQNGILHNDIITTKMCHSLQLLLSIFHHIASCHYY